TSVKPAAGRRCVVRVWAVMSGSRATAPRGRGRGAPESRCGGVGSMPSGGSNEAADHGRGPTAGGRDRHTSARRREGDYRGRLTRTYSTLGGGAGARGDFQQPSRARRELSVGVGTTDVGGQDGGGTRPERGGAEEGVTGSG